jgi:hypothetical protein
MVFAARLQFLDKHISEAVYGAHKATPFHFKNLQVCLGQQALATASQLFSFASVARLFGRARFGCG